MTVLGIIPARAESKRLPNKNLAILGGCTLVEWTIKAAVNSGVFDKIVVTTDDDRVAEVAKKHPVDILHRPEYLTHDHLPMFPVVLHAVAAYPKTIVAILLQPTSPFRDSNDIREAFVAWSRARSLVSVDPDGNENGAIFIAHVDTLKGGYIYDEDGGNFDRHKMDRVSSIDINTQGDLDRARLIMAWRANAG